MLNWMKALLELSVSKVKQLKMAFGIVGVAAAMAIAAVLLKGYFSSIAGVFVAINIGVLLMYSVLMFVATAKAKNTSANSYKKLYFIIACIFSFILLISSILSLTSVFFKYPLNFNESATGIEPAPTGDYYIKESVILTDLRKRISTEGKPGAISKDNKYRIDRVVRLRRTDNPYTIQSGTNGLKIEQESPDHPSMVTIETPSSTRFNKSTKHEYISSIASDKFPVNEIVTVQTNGAYFNAFSGEQEEWVGSCPNIDTEVLTMIVLFPENKLCKEVKAMEKPIGSDEIAYRGSTLPIIHDGGRMVTWTLSKPIKGVGYFIAFKW